MNLPILYKWDGDVMRPFGARHAKEADTQFTIGCAYRLETVPQHSQASRAHQFAVLNELWNQLPERLADEYPSPTHFRRALLIDAGLYNETVVDLGSNAKALQVAAIMRADNEFAKVVVRKGVVVRRVAKSQKEAAMNPREFQQAKTKILELAQALIDVSPATLEREAGRSA